MTQFEERNERGDSRLGLKRQRSAETCSGEMIPWEAMLLTLTMQTIA